MVTTQLEKLNKKPHVATPGTGTPYRVDVLQYIIKKIYSAERWNITPPQKYAAKETRETQTLWARQKEGGAYIDHK